MDNPINAVKSAFNLKFLIGLLVGWLIIAGILEYFGAATFLLQPIAFIKSKLNKSQGG